MRINRLLENEDEHLLEEGKIQPSISTWSSCNCTLEGRDTKILHIDYYLIILIPIHYL